MAVTTSPPSTTSTRTWEIGSLLLTVGSNPAFWGRRTRRQAGSTEPLIRLKVHAGGTSTGAIGDTAFRADPGDIHVMDLSREHYALGTTQEMFVLFVPHDVLGYDPSRHPAQFCIPGDSPDGRIVMTALEDLRRGVSAPRAAPPRAAIWTTISRT